MGDYYSSFEGSALGRADNGAFLIGKFITSNRDVHFAVDNTTRPRALDICVDDGGVAFDQGAYENAAGTRNRMLIRTAATGAICVFGSVSQLKIAPVAFTTTGVGCAGLHAYLEIVASATVVGDFAAIRATVELAASSTQTSGVISALQIDATDLTGTSSGTLACIHVVTPAGTVNWDYFLQTGACPGFFSDSDVSCTANGRIAVCIGGTVHYIPVIAAT